MLHPGLSIGGRAWQSNGGPSRRHPARALPFSLEVPLPDGPGQLVSVILVGVFALYADPDTEPAGAIGATLQLADSGGSAWRQNMILGRHYGPGGCPSLEDRSFSSELLGYTTYEGATYCVQGLRFQVDTRNPGKGLVFRDLGTPASFIIFDVLFEYEVVPVCPFRGHGNQISLSDVGKILRLRERGKFEEALQQLRTSVMKVQDIDEARGMALTFIAVVCAAMLELEESRLLHSVQLAAARQMEVCHTGEDIANCAIEICSGVVEDVFMTSRGREDPLITRALGFLDKNYASSISDCELAEKMGLSTSHFRFLFREHLGQPFHKYLISLRLEKARDILLAGGLTVSEVAEHVGFTSAAHFTRAFTKRFGASPSAFRQRRDSA